MTESTPLRLIAVTRPTMNPPYLGHITTYLYKETEIPPSVLVRMRSLKDEPTWLEVAVGNLRLDPVESIRIQGELERALMPEHRLEDVKVPYHVVSIHNYPGTPVTVTRPWAIRLTILECEIDPTVYLVKALPDFLVDRIVNGKRGIVEASFDPTNHSSVIFGDIPEDEFHNDEVWRRSEVMRKAEVPEEELSTVVIALERTYLSH